MDYIKYYKKKYLKYKNKYLLLKNIIGGNLEEDIAHLKTRIEKIRKNIDENKKTISMYESYITRDNEELYPLYGRPRPSGTRKEMLEDSIKYFKNQLIIKQKELKEKEEKLIIKQKELIIKQKELKEKREASRAEQANVIIQDKHVQSTKNNAR